MTDHDPGPDPTPDALDPGFMDEVRQMLQRRAADVPELDTQIAETTSADVVVLPGRDVGVIRPVGPLVDPSPSERPTVPLAHRVGILAAAAAVLIAVGAGLVSSLGDDTQGVAVGPADPGSTSAPVLLPPEDDGVAVVVLDEIPSSAVDSGDWTDHYGPLDGDPATGIMVVSQAMAAPVEPPDPDSDPNSEAGVGVALPGSGSGDVTADQSQVLAALGAWFKSPAIIEWAMPGPDPDGPGRSMTVFWHGEGVTVERGLAVATRVAEDPDRELDGAPLPDGWGLTDRSGGTHWASGGYTVALDGQMTGGLTAWNNEQPLWLPLVDTGQTGVSWQHREVEVRGTTGLLITAYYDGDGQSPSLIEVLWTEGGSSYHLDIQGPGPEPDEVVALAERLVEVDIETARQRYGRTDRQVVPETVPPEPVLPTTEPSDTIGSGPSIASASITAPITPASTTEPPTDSTPPTTEPITDSTPPTTEPPTGSTPPTTGTTIVPGQLRPEGDFVDDSIVPVMASGLGGIGYEVGVHWSPRHGLCVGVDLDGDLTGGGYPVACEIEPLIGGGDRRQITGVGTVAFAFVADEPAVARAELTLELGNLGATVHQATIHRVDEFPQFAFLVFGLAGVPADALDSVFLPGDIVLYDGAGRPLGWG